MTSNIKLVEGEIFNLGGQEYQIPALNLRGYRESEKDIREINQSFKTLQDGVLPEKLVDSICRVVLRALQRNYPQETFEGLKDKLDLNNCMPILVRVLRLSGLKEPKVGEA